MSPRKLTPMQRYLRAQERANFTARNTGAAVYAWHEGECDRCGGIIRIAKDGRAPDLVIRQGEGWIHRGCAPGGDDL